MKKVEIVFWSGTGNTAAMAEYIAEGAREAGAKADIIPVSAADIEKLKELKGFALGCPSMGAEQLEESEMEPFMCQLERVITGKQIALFGSYGWGNQEWMRDWEDRVNAAGASVINREGFAILGLPGDEQREECRSLGKALAELED